MKPAKLTFNDCRKWREGVIDRHYAKLKFEKEVQNRKNVCCMILKAMTPNEARFFVTPYQFC